MWIRTTTEEEARLVSGLAPTSQGQVFYRTVPGDVDGLPTFILHQSPLNSAQYRRALPLLADRGLRPFALDTPGHGGSFTPHGEWEISDYAATVLEVADHLGFEKFALIARATGATIGVEVALTKPERVLAMAIHGLPVYRDEERAERLEGFAPVLDLAPDGQHVLGVWDRIMDQYPALEPELATQFLIDYLGSGPDYARAYRAVFRYDMPERFPGMTAPYAIWYGELDRLGFMRDRPREVVADADVRTFAGEDDFIAWRSPSYFADEVAGFLAGAVPAA